MPFDFTLINQSPSDGALLMFDFKERLKVNGWSVTRSGDGIGAVSAVGDVITQGGSGANGMFNSRAWFVIAQPGGAGARKWCVQKTTVANGANWRIKVSQSEAYSAGAPTTSVTPTTPTASEDKIMLGGGTDASPTFAALWATDGSYKAQAAIETAGEGFWIATYPNGGGAASGGWYMERLITGTFNALDVDPYIYCTIGTTAPWLSTGIAQESAGLRPQAWLARGLAGEGFVICPATYPANTASSILPGNLGSNAFDGKDNSMPVIYMRRGSLTAPVGWKGQSSMLRWKGNNRNTADTLNSLSRIVIGDVSMEWDGVTVPIV